MKAVAPKKSMEMAVRDFLRNYKLRSIASTSPAIMEAKKKRRLNTKYQSSTKFPLTKILPKTRLTCRLRQKPLKNRWMTAAPSKLASTTMNR